MHPEPQPGPDPNPYRALYCLGRHSKINFPLSDEERAELDTIGIAGVLKLYHPVRKYSRNKIIIIIMMCPRNVGHGRRPTR